MLKEAIFKFTIPFTLLAWAFTIFTPTSLKIETKIIIILFVTIISLVIILISFLLKLNKISKERIEIEKNRNALSSIVKIKSKHLNLALESNSRAVSLLSIACANSKEAKLNQIHDTILQEYFILKGIVENENN